MASIWTIARADTECGYDGGRIAKGDPMQEIRLPGVEMTRRRCVHHATIPVNDAAIDAARAAAVNVEERLALADQAPAFVDPRTPFRVARPKPVKSFASLADVATPFDPKVAAAGDRD